MWGSRPATSITTIAACLLAGSVATTSAAAAADSGGARSQVTIDSYSHGVFGYVRSAAPRRCADGRPVKVFVRRAWSRGGSRRVVGKTVARKLAGADGGHRFGWSLAAKRRADMFARVAAKHGCAPARTRGTAPAGSADIPACPSDDSNICRLNELHFDTGICPNFTSFGGECSGSVSGPSYWNTETATLRWSGNGLPNNVHIVRLFSNRDRPPTQPGWELYGLISGTGSPNDWPVTDAWNKHCCPHWRSGGPGDGPRDTPFGPLYWYFDNGIVGADVYVRGYLHLKPN
jgi:hypothetical protein